jgi:RNA polymerase sigma-70 factor, ECF subfamily
MGNNKTEIKFLQDKDIKSFEKLFREYYQALCNYAHKYIDEIEDCEEIVQDLFFKIWESRNSLQINYSLKAYLYKSVHNNCLLYLQHKQVERKYEEAMKMTPDFDVYDEDAASLVKSAEIQNIITETLRYLPEQCSRIFCMNRYDGLKYQEIADKLSISIKTVEANITRALKAFKKSLAEYSEAY